MSYFVIVSCRILSTLFRDYFSYLVMYMNGYIHTYIYIYIYIQRASPTCSTISAISYDQEGRAVSAPLQKQLMQSLEAPSRKRAPNFNLIKFKYQPINKIIFLSNEKQEKNRERNATFTIFSQHFYNKSYIACCYKLLLMTKK